jgi:hypothetical protein
MSDPRSFEPDPNDPSMPRNRYVGRQSDVGSGSGWIICGRYRRRAAGCRGLQRPRHAGELIEHARNHHRSELAASGPQHAAGGAGRPRVAAAAAAVASL